MMEIPDSAMIQQLKAKNETAFKMLVEKYKEMVVRVSNGFVHNANDANDIAQEVFIEVYRSVANFRENARIATWLYRITVNKSLNFIRDNKRNKLFRSIESFFADEQYPESITDNSYTDSSMERNQRTTMIDRAISSLPKNQRIAFILNKYDDLSYSDVAEVMNVSLASVESLIHRAKLNLQKKLMDCYKKNEC